MKQVILFDLDGTLTESGEGIVKSVQYALEKMGKPEPETEKLRVFIGPPLQEQFVKYTGMNEAEAKQAVAYYRERYSTIGIFENKPYPGIKEMLKRLKKQGALLAVASSKPEKFVLQVLEHFGMCGYFDEIVGSEMDGRRNRKVEVIEEALCRLQALVEKDRIIMVGDKEHDVFGARQAEIDCVAVGYGYGTTEELDAAKPLKIVHTVEELLEYLLSFCA